MLNRVVEPVNPFQKFVAGHARLLQTGKKLPSGHLQKISPRPKQSVHAPKVLIFSPHPDDECITGGLALRLLREAKWKVINVAVTLGSKRGRRAARLRELQNACASLGFDLLVANERGLDHINPEARRGDRRHWRAAVKAIAGILAEHQPKVIFVPHEHDGHETHIGTHWLIRDALGTLPRPFTCHVAETEFWGQMTKPNLLVESSVNDVVALVAALACHVGEVKRNAYHARLPAWMMDNVRRGAELIGGLGSPAPNFVFGTIYRLSEWNGGKVVPVNGKFLSSRGDVAALFKV